MKYVGTVGVRAPVVLDRFVKVVSVKIQPLLTLVKELHVETVRFVGMVFARVPVLLDKYVRAESVRTLLPLTLVMVSSALMDKYVLMVIV